MAVAKKIFFVVALALLGGSVSFGQTDSAAFSIRYDVEFLSDPICGGRATGTPGASEATRHILHRLRAAGLEPVMQSFNCKGVVGRNLIAEIKRPGAKQWVVIIAYYDGLGKRGGVLYPGADSNASGVAALLSLADTLFTSPLKKYNVLLAFLDGHNSEFAGASVLLRKTLVSRSVRIVVDLDIIGSSLAPYKPYQKDYLIALGGRPYKKTFDALGQRHGLTVYYDYYGSRDFTDLFYTRMGDRSLFIKQELPVMMFTSGITMNTNKATDTAQTLDYGQTSRRVALILDWLRTL